MEKLQGVQAVSSTTQAFIQVIRLFMRDHPQLNRLVAGEESSDRMIGWAILDALADFNGTPPFIGNFGLDDLLAQNQQSLLTRMVTCSLIESIGLLQTRNHLNYSNGGVNVGVNDKTPQLLNWLQYFKGTTEQMKQRVKVSMNINQILGPGNAGVYSELAAVNASYIAF